MCQAKPFGLMLIYWSLLSRFVRGLGSLAHKGLHGVAAAICFLKGAFPCAFPEAHPVPSRWCITLMRRNCREQLPAHLVVYTSERVRWFRLTWCPTSIAYEFLEFRFADVVIICDI
eukprot:s2836_g6.t1